jgi:hypothetical protein
MPSVLVSFATGHLGIDPSDAVVKQLRFDAHHKSFNLNPNVQRSN